MASNRPSISEDTETSSPPLEKIDSSEFTQPLHLPESSKVELPAVLGDSLVPSGSSIVKSTNHPENPNPESAKALTVSTASEGNKIQAVAGRDICYFLDMEPKDRQQVLEYALLERHRDIRPYYRRGMLHHGIWSDGSMNYVVDNENVDLGILRVNKVLSKQGIAIFYGQNFFTFEKAEVCRWWVQHIGQAAFSQIRSMTLNMGTGYFIHHMSRSVEELSQEETWFNVICWMQNRHKFDELYILFTGWATFGARHLKHLNKSDIEEMDKYRLRIIDKLQRFRGIPHVEIRTNQSPYLKRREADNIAMMMGQPREEPKPKPKELSLASLMEVLREERQREAQEAMQEALRQQQQQRRHERNRYYEYLPR